MFISRFSLLTLATFCFEFTESAPLAMTTFTKIAPDSTASLSAGRGCGVKVQCRTSSSSALSSTRRPVTVFSTRRKQDPSPQPSPSVLNTTHSSSVSFLHNKNITSKLNNRTTSLVATSPLFPSFSSSKKTSFISRNSHRTSVKPSASVPKDKTAGNFATQTQKKSNSTVRPKTSPVTLLREHFTSPTGVLSVTPHTTTLVKTTKLSTSTKPNKTTTIPPPTKTSFAEKIHSTALFTLVSLSPSQTTATPKSTIFSDSSTLPVKHHSTLADRTSNSPTQIKQPIIKLLLLIDRDSDGIITDAELDAWVERFDFNRDGLSEELEFATRWQKDAEVDLYRTKAVFTLLDTDENGALNSKDTARLASDMDVNGNSVITKPEFLQHWTKLLEQAELYSLFLQADTDGDLQLDFSEVEGLGMKFDKNSDKKLDEDEFVRMLRGQALLDAQLAGRGFLLADRNQDSFVDESDMRGAFGNYDKNGNGYITKTEYLTHFKKVLVELKSNSNLELFGAIAAS